MLNVVPCIKNWPHDAKLNLAAQYKGILCWTTSCKVKLILTQRTDISRGKAFLWCSYTYFNSPKSLGIWNKVSHKYTREKNKIPSNCYFIWNKTLNSDYAELGAAFCNICLVSSTTFQFITMTTTIVSVFSDSIVSAFLKGSLGRNHLAAAAIKAASAKQQMTATNKSRVWFSSCKTSKGLDAVNGTRSRSSNFTAGSLPKPPKCLSSG